jgi:hypothetical protein
VTGRVLIGQLSKTRSDELLPSFPIERQRAKPVSTIHNVDIDGAILEMLGGFRFVHVAAQIISSTEVQIVAKLPKHQIKISHEAEVIQTPNLAQLNNFMHTSKVYHLQVGQLRAADEICFGANGWRRILNFRVFFKYCKLLPGVKKMKCL